MDLFELKIEIPAASADRVDEVLLEAEVGEWSLLEDAIARRAWIVGIFPQEAEALTAWESLRLLLPIEPLGPPHGRNLASQDWRDSYKAHFKAWKFGRLHWVPLWEKETFHLPDGDAVIWLDPGLAFGTGNHETTRLCVERLVALVEKQGPIGRVIDAGCGSGILALSASRLGFKNVVGFDNDPEAVRVSQENATLNGLSSAVVFSTADLISGLKGLQAGILLANIQADVLVRFAKELAEATAPGGTLVLSGILATENVSVRGVFAALLPSWQIDGRIMGEWSDLNLFRPK